MHVYTHYVTIVMFALPFANVGPGEARPPPPPTTELVLFEKAARLMIRVKSVHGRGR